MKPTAYTSPIIKHRHLRSFISVALLLFLVPAVSAQSDSPLSQGIALFEQGDDTAALSAFNEAVRENTHTPLAYFYAAWIRIHRNQYDRALANLELALADSTGFDDVHSLRAIAYRGLGDTDNARKAWQMFIAATGTLDGIDTDSLDAIMPPDEYRELFAAQEARKLDEQRLAREQAEEDRRLREEQERQRRKQATADSLAEIDRRVQATADSIAHAEAMADSIAQAQAQAAADSIDTLKAAAAQEPTQSTEPPTPATETDRTVANSDTQESQPTEYDAWETDTGSGIGLSFDDTPLRDIENQISADIKSIIYWLAGIGVILLLGIGVMLFRSRRRRTRNDETIFSEQVERMLDDIQFEVSENQAISEFERKRQEIAEEIATLRTESAATEKESGPDQSEQTAETGPATPRSPFTPPEEEPEPDNETEHPSKSSPTHTSLITEEVKTLVSRLAREGKPPAEIARAADLTVTEVNLILAVRERRIKNIAEDIHHDEDATQRDQLIGAITSLRHEGASPREIARKLDISISEVELALSINSFKHQSDHDG